VPFAPTLIGPADANPGPNILIVSGNQVVDLVGIQTFVKITGDGVGGPDSLTLNVVGDVILDGFVGGFGLTNITIHAFPVNNTDGGTITITEGTTISSRQVTGGSNHWDAASTGCFGNITLDASVIQIEDGANIIAHATNGFTAGNVSLTAHDTYTQSWAFLSVPLFRWIETEANIEIGMDARLTGNDITIQTTAETIKNASLPDGGIEFSYPRGRCL
jgi:hypothetical protein